MRLPGDRRLAFFNPSGRCWAGPDIDAVPQLKLGQARFLLRLRGFKLAKETFGWSWKML